MTHPLPRVTGSNPGAPLVSIISHDCLQTCFWTPIICANLNFFDLISNNFTIWLDGKSTFLLKNLINVQYAVERISNFDGACLALRCGFFLRFFFFLFSLWFVSDSAQYFLDIKNRLFIVRPNVKRRIGNHTRSNVVRETFALIWRLFYSY